MPIMNKYNVGNFRIRWVTVLPQLTLSSSRPFFARYVATFSLVLDKSRLAWNWRREREEGGKKIWCSPSHDRQVNPSFPQCSASATRGPYSSHANRVTRELYNLTNFLTVSWLTINSCRFSRSWCRVSPCLSCEVDGAAESFITAAHLSEDGEWDEEEDTVRQTDWLPPHDGRRALECHNSQRSGGIKRIEEGKWNSDTRFGEWGDEFCWTQNNGRMPTGEW